MITGTGTIFLGKNEAPDPDTLIANCLSEFRLSQERSFQRRQSKAFDGGFRSTTSLGRSLISWVLELDIDRVGFEVFKKSFNITDPDVLTPVKSLTLNEINSGSLTSFYNESKQSADETLADVGDIVSYLTEVEAGTEVECFGAGTNVNSLSFFGVTYNNGSLDYSVYIPEMVPTGSISYDFGTQDTISLRFIMVNRVNPVLRRLS